MICKHHTGNSSSTKYSIIINSGVSGYSVLPACTAGNREAVDDNLILYRKRLIPEECIELKDDILLYRDNELIITKWNTLHPKKTLHHG